MPKILDVNGCIIFNSRGEETIEVIIKTEGGEGRYASPTGLSTGSLEVKPYPRGGIDEAMKLLKREIKAKLIGFTYDSQEEFDSYIGEIDGTGNYGRIGGVLSLGLSMAAAEAASTALNIPLYYWLGGEDTNYLPVPLGNIVGGGRHAKGRSIDIQEILAFPVNAGTIREAVNAMIALHREVGGRLASKDRFFTAGRNDEGAWVTTLPETEVFNLMWEAIDEIKGRYNIKFALGIDIAATSLWDGELKLYVYNRAKKLRDRREQIEYVLELIKDYNLSYVEDPLNEQDFPGFSEITKRTNKTIIAGDDLYVTNLSRLVLGISEGAGNSVIIKPNQVGDLTKSKKAAEVAKRGAFKVIASHRSGETTYPHLASIAVAYRADMIKTGVLGGERIQKLNTLIKIEEGIGNRVRPAILHV